MGVSEEALQSGVSYKAVFLIQVMLESVSVLQITWESVSGTTSHVCASKRANEIEGSYDKIIIIIVPSYTGRRYHSFVAVGIVTVHSKQYRRQQTCDIFRYSYVLWWYLYPVVSR